MFDIKEKQQSVNTHIFYELRVRQRDEVIEYIVYTDTRQLWIKSSNSS